MATSGQGEPGPNGAPVLLPTVALVVAMRNEEAFIEACLRSIGAQDYPGDRLEVFIEDGESTDRSVEIATSIAAGHPNWHVVTNPRRIQAAAWNDGIRSASAEIAGIVSGHSVLAADYVRRAVEVLQQTRADMVGGPVRPIGEGRIGRAVAAATSTAFGVGGARHHYTTKPTEVDTVFMGVARRATWLRYPFDERFVRDQDDEQSYRLGSAGGRIVCDPSIRSEYVSRASLGGVWRQYFDYGLWKVPVLRAHPRRLRIRHLVPAVFVSSVALTAAAGLIWKPARLLLGLVVSTYTAVLAIAVVATAGAKRVDRLLPLAAVYPVIHIAYGVGTLIGAWDQVRVQLGNKGR